VDNSRRGRPHRPNLAWRRHTFKSLGELIPAGQPGADPHTVLAAFPTPAQADAWRLDVLTRLFGQTQQDTSEVPPVANGLTLAGPNPIYPTLPQVFPPIPQQCSLIMGGNSSFSFDGVQAQSVVENNVPTGAPVTFETAFWIVVDGFDPAEVTWATMSLSTPMRRRVSPRRYSRERSPTRSPPRLPSTVRPCR
jgi:hypothetical protein